MRGQATDPKSLKQIESENRVRRQIQNVQPYEYTIYLAPEQDAESPIPDESTFEQIKSICPIGTSDPSQSVSHPSDILKAIQELNIPENGQIPHPNYSHQRSCPPCAHSPVTQTVSTHNQISTVVPNCIPPHSCPPLQPNNPLPLNSNTKSPSICHCPLIPAHPPVSVVPMPLNTVPTPTQQTNATNPVNCETSTVLPLPNTSPSSIVTATTPPPLVTTPSLPNPTLSALCQSHNNTGACNIVIKKAIILLNGGQNTTNLPSIAKAFSNLNDNDDDSDDDFEDLLENDDVTILDGSKDLMLNETGIDSSVGSGNESKKSSSIGLKIISLLEKVHHELQISNKYKTDSFHYDDYSDDADGDEAPISIENDYHDEIEHNTTLDSEHANQYDRNVRNPNEQNVKKCETGEDLVEACKNLSKTISSYQQPAQKQT